MRSTIAGCIFLLLLQATTPPRVNSAASQQQTTADRLAEADRLNDQILSLNAKNQTDEAIVLAKRVLELTEMSVDPQHLRIASAASNLAQLYMLKGKRREAEQLLLRAIQINQAKLKASDPLLVGDLERYACVLVHSDKYKQLKEFDQQRAAELKKAPQSDSYWGNVVNVTKTITWPKPDYPLFMQGRNGGIILIRVHVDEQGRVTNAKSQCGGDRYLVVASEAAARQARFEPVMVDAKPIRIIGYLVYNFVHR